MPVQYMHDTYILIQSHILKLNKIKMSHKCLKNESMEPLMHSNNFTCDWPHLLPKYEAIYGSLSVGVNVEEERIEKMLMPYIVCRKAPSIFDSETLQHHEW